MLNKLVIIARAGWISRNGVTYFQDNDGYYIDSIAPLFERIDVISREINEAELLRVHYAYRFSNKNIRLKRGMEPFRLRHPYQILVAVFTTLKTLVNADVVYSFVNTVRGSLYLLLASYMFRKKTIAYNGSNRKDVLAAYGISGLRNKLSLFLENEAMKRADARIVTGPLLYARYSVLGPTFMATPLSRVLQKEAGQRAPRGVRESIRLLSIAHLRKEKNFDILIRACGVLRERGMRFELNVVGDGLVRPELEKLAHSLGVNDCVVFHGYISDLEELSKQYCHNDILLLASQVEGFPRAVWEAIHFGLYVILAEVGGVGSIFDNNDMHILKHPTPEAYADAILEVSRNPEKLFSSVQSAQAKFDKLFAQSPVEQFQNCLAILGNE